MTNRPLVLAVCSLVMGIAAVILSKSILIGFLLFVAGVSFIIIRRKNPLPVIFLMLIFFVCGGLRMNIAQKHRNEIIVSYDSQVKAIEVLVTDFSDGKSVTGEFKDKGNIIKIYLNMKNPKRLYPGDIIYGEFSLRKPFSSKISLSDFSSYLCSRNIYLQASVDDITVTDCYKNGIRGLCYTLRRYVNSLGELNFDGNEQSLFSAMVLGDKSLMSDELTQNLQGAGLNHIAVVSGMHLSIMIALQMMVLNAIFGKRRAGSFLAIAGAIFITLATGAGASVVRACVMCIVYQVARVCYRDADSITSLMIAVGIMCIYNPYILFNAGFILSVLSVLGIVLYNGKINTALRHFLPERISSAAAMCISSQLAVTPAVMYYFNIFTPYALVANVLIFAFVTAVIVAGLAFCVFANVPFLGGVLAYTVRISCNVIEYICSSVSGLDKAVINTVRPGGFFILIWVFVLILIYLYPKKRNMMLPVCTIFVIMTVILTHMEYRGRDDINLSFLTYASRTTTAAQLPGGELLLIDCGDKWDGAELADYYGRSSFDYVFLTGTYEEEVLDLAKEGYVKSLFLPDELYSEEKKNELIKAAKEYNLRTEFLKSGEYIFTNGTFIEYMPVEQISNEARAVKIEYKGKSFVTLQGLESADIEALCESKVKISCDYLKLPFIILGEENDVHTLTDGQIVQTEKEFNIR